MAGINRTTGKATDLITFSRSSGGTALRKISYGSELVTNGTFDTDTSGWNVTGGSISVVSQQLNVVGGTSYCYTSFATEIGKVYTVSGDIIQLGSSFTAIRKSDNSNASSNVVTIGSTVGSHSGFFVATATTTFIALQVNSTGTGIFDNISVKEVLFDQPDGTLTLFNHPDNIPRIEYAPDGTVKGLLIEEARTNLVTYSEDFTNAYWTRSSTTVSGGVTDPNGSSDAFAVTAGTSGAWWGRVVAGTVSGSAYTASIWIRRRTGTGAVRLYYGQSNTLYDITSQLTSEWQRITAIPGIATGTDFFGINFAVSGDAVDIWGAQLEAGSFPTSYIPTSGATATRAADIASISVDSFGYRQDAGTVVVEFDTNGSDGADYPRIFSLSNSTQTDLARFLVNPTNTTTVAVIENSVGVALTGWSGSISPNTAERIAVSLKRDNFAASLSGASTQTDTSGNMPAAANTLAIGAQANLLNNYLNGHIKSIQYYPRRLSNAQLQELTA